MKKISIIIAKQHYTSITLEEEFYIQLQNIAKKQNKSINTLVTDIDVSGTHINLSSAIRIYILQYLQNEIKKITAD